ncbi:MAG TPA: hypothetical protein VLB44_20090 [Kofleriaceae bacterium]|nr:hypothetical protein [Kofleriaceae bacterium]
MIRLAYAVLLLPLAACPAKHGGTVGPTNQAAGAGCPSAAGVYFASYVTQEPAKGRSGWVVPLHAQAAQPGAPIADYASIDAAAATAAGVPAAPQGKLWLATQHAPPCPLKLGSYYAAKVEGPPAGVSYGVEVDGCPAPANAEDAGGILLVSDESPSGCRFEPPQPLAARLGQTDAQKQWQRPTKETPIPPTLSALIPPHTCNPPDCETLWAFAEVKVENKTVAWTGAVNWLTIGAPAEQCQWKSERFSGFFVPTPTGAVKVTEGQDHPLALSAALVDSSGAKGLLAEGPGEYATFDLTADGTKLGHHLTWMIVPPDAWNSVDDIGPICEDTAKPPSP